MSLLEDVFLEDEAGEAQELERVIEGDEFDEQPAAQSGEDSNEDSEKEDEAEEDKRRVDPTSVKTKRVVNPRVILNPARLMGPRGIQVIPDHFKDFKFKGKGHEKEDLDLVLKKLEHWAYRLYPKFQFEDCLKKIETLGRKRPVMVHLHKIRSDQYISDDVVVQKDSSDDEAPQPEVDEFDKLLQQQIELARATPAPNSAKKLGLSTPMSKPSPFSMPKATSSPSISEEQKERMLRNRKLAEERRLARLKMAENNVTVINEETIEIDTHQSPIIKSNENVTVVHTVTFHVENHQNDSNSKQDNSQMTVVNEIPFDVDHGNDEPRKKQKKANVIDSSDDECEELVVNESITVDVHDTRQKNNSSPGTDEAQRLSNKIYSSDEELERSNDENEIKVGHDNEKLETSNDTNKSYEETAENTSKSANIQDNITDRIHNQDISLEINKNNDDINQINNFVDNDQEKRPETNEKNADMDDTQEINIMDKNKNLTEEEMAIDEDNSDSKVNKTNGTVLEVCNKNNEEIDFVEITNNNEDTKVDKVVTDETNNEHNREMANETDEIDKISKECNHSINETSKETMISNIDKDNVDRNIDLDLMEVDFDEDF
ncbi:homeobox protein 2 [Amyelois transitella]|uniref:homeobox protein 2 n=1 Tax=Amyelois transitella TaxID=680683 RepID=UPI00067E3530|nr:homeobox protein 2 [Amyelois transitella]